MKEMVKFEEQVGGDGASVKGALGVEGSNLKLELSAMYPIEKIVEPATKAVDSLLDKVKALIPGDWDDVMIEKFKVEYKEELVKMLSE